MEEGSLALCPFHRSLSADRPRDLSLRARSWLGGEMRQNQLTGDADGK